MTQDNVVPGEARAVVNHRIHPTETLDDILQHDKKVINDDRVEIKTLGYFPPPSISPYSNDVSPFQIVANSALQVKSSATPSFCLLNSSSGLPHRPHRPRHTGGQHGHKTLPQPHKQCLQVGVNFILRRTFSLEECRESNISTYNVTQVSPLRPGI